MRHRARWHGRSGRGCHARPAGTRRTGTQIGPYKLREQIGEGGLGIVYMAEQRNPSAARWP